ncbi:MAG: alpha/beta hydrolase [Actinomycetia bacterium]|nr:alpha/beta hydrolase [Actinomycetes bacterium]MCP4228512.1 alpha/beta hydrolase [Actinomycetes bacterium]MCP5031697.1 alpha/beta hydrolase [Actinomycetes bacterium]
MISSETTFYPSTDGVQVAVHDFGGQGRLLLFCHATGFCAHTWSPMIESLADQFHCVALDVRAHGLTKLPVGASLAWRGMADDVTAVIEALSPDEPMLTVGHSLGGSAIILAETGRPGLVERAWMFEPILMRAAPVAIGRNAPDIANAARGRRATFASRQEAVERFARRPPLSLLDPRALEAYVEHGFEYLPDGSVTLRCRPEDEASVFEHHFSGTFERAADLTIPVVMATGGGSQGPADRVAEAAAANPALKRVEYQDLSHFGPLQAPDRLAADVAAFMLDTPSA